MLPLIYLMCDTCISLRKADCKGQEKQGACTWRHCLHVFGKLAADAIIISADVMETPS